MGIFLIISPFDEIWTIKNLFPHDLHIYLIICMKQNAQFIFLKIPPRLVTLLGKVHALSIEVLYKARDFFKNKKEKEPNWSNGVPDT